MYCSLSQVENSDVSCVNNNNNVIVCSHKPSRAIALNNGLSSDPLNNDASPPVPRSGTKCTWRHGPEMCNESLHSSAWIIAKKGIALHSPPNDGSVKPVNASTLHPNVGALQARGSTTASEEAHPHLETQ